MTYFFLFKTQSYCMDTEDLQQCKQVICTIIIVLFEYFEACNYKLPLFMYVKKQLVHSYKYLLLY